MSCDFTYNYYRKMLQAALDKGYEFIFFPEFENTRKTHTVLLRHDIDFSVISALAMAEVEAELGVKSTYFFRWNSTFYSPTSQADYPRIRRIIDLGHDIGLHFDPGFYEANGIEFYDGIQRDKLMLETAFDYEIKSISQHRPTTLGQLEPTPEQKELMRYFTYNDIYVKNAKYISESCQRWREGDLIDKLGQHQHIQVLVHPGWWCEEFLPWQECLKDMGTTLTDSIHDKIDLLIDRYTEYLDKREDNRKASNG